MNNIWFVSRQSYWGVDEDDQYMVEIALGGCDYANADMLVTKYAGEGEEYTNPVEAVEKALEIRDAWKKDQPDSVINVGYGCTFGDTMPFEGDTDEELKKWAQKQLDALPRCDQCGEVICGNPLRYHEYPDFQFCREYCAEKWLAEQYEEEEEVG
jgi:hypothetical protein